MLRPVSSLLRFLVWTLLIVGIILGAARALAVRWFRLPQNDVVFEASVSPTLRGGDLVLAARVTTPTFGDLVVCPEPDYPTRFIVGRIVGEPGDSVQIIDSVPTVNGKPFRIERSCDVFMQIHPDNDAEEVKQHCGWEAMANHLHMMGQTSNHVVTPETVQVDVPEGKLFLLSDNRLFPYDSRDYGLVDASTCKETIVARLISREGWMDSERRLDYIQ